MRKEFLDETWNEVELMGRKCLFNDLRISRASVEKHGLLMYELADAESNGIPCRMRPAILVNFFGTIVTDKPFEPDVDGSNYFDEDRFWYLDNYYQGEEALEYFKEKKAP